MLVLEIALGVFLGGGALWLAIQGSIRGHTSQHADMLKNTAMLLSELYGLDALGKGAKNREEERERKET